MNGVKRLNSLLNYLLTLTTKNNLQKSQTNITEIVNNTISTIKNLTTKETIQFVNDIKKPFIVDSDERLIKQVFQNIFDNALKYSIKINGKYRPIDISLHTSKLDSTITISNPSKEISEEQLKHLFDRFYQVDQSRNKRVSGYGLGLSIVKKIIEDHGWTVTASYADGTFNISIIIPRQ